MSADVTLCVRPTGTTVRHRQAVRGVLDEIRDRLIIEAELALGRAELLAPVKKPCQQRDARIYLQRAEVARQTMQHLDRPKACPQQATTGTVEQ
jgi:hypothetical protein